MTETARAVQIATIAGILRDNGIDPVPMLLQCGFAPDTGHAPEELVSLQATLSFATLAQRALKDAHFGLAVGERVSNSGFEALMAPSAACPDLRSAIHVLAEVVRRYRRGMVCVIQEQGGLAVVEVRLTAPAMEGAALLADTAMVMATGALRRLAGPGFRLAEARFPYSRPQDLRRHRRLFAAPLAFDADHAALVMDVAWLDRKIDPTRPQIRALLDAWPPMAAEPASTFADEVAFVLHRETGGGGSQAKVARRLGLGVRAMHRRLAAEGTNFHAIRTRLRHQRACFLLTMTAMPMAQIAQALDYSEASAFARAFRSAAGCTPTEWRRRDAARRA